ncbi:hypothetical protein [Streptomyces sp. NPDC093984]
MQTTRKRPDTRQGSAERTHLAVVEAAEDGTTTEWDAHVRPEDHPA